MTVKKVPQARPPHRFEEYTRIISPLSREDGGGFLITFPDLPGCMADGETEEEALENGKDAFLSWVSARVDQKKAIPDPEVRPGEFVTSEASGRFVTRIPKTLHSRLAMKAKAEGVSLNSLVLAFIAAGLK